MLFIRRLINEINFRSNLLHRQRTNGGPAVESLSRPIIFIFFELNDNRHG